jgi:hypothetical protein
MILCQQYDTDNGFEYVRTVMTKRKGIQHLVEQVEGKKKTGSKTKPKTSAKSKTKKTSNKKK